MTVKIEVTGKSIEAALAAFGANLARVDTDTLVATLKDRLASEDPPRILRIVPFTGKSSRS